MFWNHFLWFAIGLSGGTALLYQMAWQRYLTYLIGGQSRSVSLVVAIFLIGLAAGYWYWGRFARGNRARQKVLRAYGYIEMAIAFYALLFHHAFLLVQKLNPRLPDHLTVDTLVTVVLLAVPTFCMGATIPMLTAALPKNLSEVNRCHAKIYAINTFGALAGTV